MNHYTTRRFWEGYQRLPGTIQRIADENYELLRANPLHPSLHFKRIGKLWSVRVTDDYRALAVQEGGDYIWFWIGSHDEYERIIQRRN